VTRRALALGTVVVVAAAGVAGCGHPVAGGRPLAPPPLAACRPGAGVPCYGQDPVHRAYRMGAVYARGITGAGTTVAVLVPYSSPWLAADLGTYSRFYRLPRPRLRVYSWRHAPAAPPGSRAAAGWIQEGTADLEMAHYMAPGAALTYVALPPRGAMPAAMAALDWLAARGRVTVASFSWGFCEKGTAVPYLRALSRGLAAAAARGVSIIAGSGDYGPTCPGPRGLYRTRAVTWPTSDPLVTAVGSLTLHLNPQGRRLSPDAVTGAPRATGGGLSACYPRPPYQDHLTRIVGASRGVVDISMTGRAWAYIAVPGLPGAPPWHHAAGTSIAAPLLAGIIADAAQDAGRRLGPLGPALYRMHGPGDGITDITRGDNTDHGVPGYPAAAGYDLSSGIGTPSRALAFITTLARLDHPPPPARPGASRPGPAGTSIAGPNETPPMKEKTRHAADQPGDSPAAGLPGRETGAGVPLPEDQQRETAVSQDRPGSKSPGKCTPRHPGRARIRRPDRLDQQSPELQERTGHAAD
jgi:hypothetical protein